MGKRKQHNEMTTTMMTTIKLDYDLVYGDRQLLIKYNQQYSTLVHIFYNILVDDPKFTYNQVREKVKNYNNLELMDYCFVRSALQDAQILYNRFNKEKSNPIGHKIIFGGRNNFIKRVKGKLSNSEFKKLRLRPIFFRGEANQLGNRRLRIRDKKHIDFVVDRKVVFTFRIKDRRCKILNALKHKQDNKEIPITYRLSENKICITYDRALVKPKHNNKVFNDRLIAIDLNPDYIGIAIFDIDQNGHRRLYKAIVIDWYDITDKQKNLHQQSSSELNKYYNNKRKFEIQQGGKYIVKLAEHYQCKFIVLEDLEFKSYSGFRISKWHRGLIYQSIYKHTTNTNIAVLQVNPAYTSLIGNVLCKHKIPDMCRSAYEIGYRALIGIKNGSFNKDGVDKTSHIHSFEITKNFIIKTLQSDDKIEQCNNIKSYAELNKFIKENHINYRVSIKDCEENQTVSNFRSERSLVKIRSYGIKTFSRQVVDLKNSMEENVSDVETTSLLNVKTKRNLNKVKISS